MATPTKQAKKAAPARKRATKSAKKAAKPAAPLAPEVAPPINEERASDSIGAITYTSPEPGHPQYSHGYADGSRNAEQAFQHQLDNCPFRQFNARDAQLRELESHMAEVKKQLDRLQSRAREVSAEREGFRIMVQAHTIH